MGCDSRIFLRNASMDCAQSLLSAKKIMIFGMPGSGKSTFSLQLSLLLKLPLFHLDRHFFSANWVEVNQEEFLRIPRGFVEQEKWIIDGNALRSLEMRFSRADVILYFRFNRLLCLFRLFKRLFYKDSQICDRAEGCFEKLRLRLIRYLWNFDKRVKEPIQELRKKYPKAKFYEIGSDQELRALLTQLKTLLKELY